MCDHCDGTGKWFNAKRTASIECRTCKGTGKKPEKKQELIHCDKCDGVGRIFDSQRDANFICKICQGVGKKIKSLR
jgi:DnaJ-class molecular chaperone